MAEVYGSLVVPVTADTRALSSQVASEATRAGNDAGERISKGIGSHLGASAARLGKGVATALGTGVLAVTAFGAQSIKVAAQVDKMNSTLGALAKANGLSQGAVFGTVAALRKQGIQVEAAQSVVADFAKGHINLANATKLTTVAQNASVVSGKSASDVLESITKTIETGNVRQLRQAGLIINTKDAYKAYATELGTTTSKLTSAQRQTALINAIMEEGKNVAGAYAASLDNPARVLKSFPRIAHDIQVSLGEQLIKGIGPLIVASGKLARGLRDALAPGGALAPVLSTVGTIAQRLVAPFTQIITLAAKWTTTLKPGTLAPILAQVTKFAPAFASLATALGAFAGGQFLQKIPLLGGMFSGLTGPVGAVVTGLVTLAATSPAARQALGQLATGLMAGLAPIMRELVPIIGQLGTALGTVLGAALQALLPLVPPLVAVLRAALVVILPLVPAITVLANVLAAMAPVLVPLIVAWKAWGVAIAIQAAATEGSVVAMVAVRIATLAWAAAQWVLNAALDGNPIGIVILALFALGTALTIAWTKSATFRAIVIDTWHAIQSTVGPILAWLAGAVSATFNTIRSVVGTVTAWIRANIGTLMTVLVGLFTGGLGAVVILVIKNWAAIKATIANAMGSIQNAVAAGWRGLISTASNLLGSLAGVISRTWSNIVAGARLAGGNIINGLRAGMAAAISGIGSWIKGNIVDPIVNSVKHFFGIHSPSVVMQGIGTMLVRGLFLGMTPGISGIGSMVGQVFGGFPAALGAMISHGLIGVASLPGKALTALMSLFGGGDAGQLAMTASKYGGHRYVWGGGANPSTGFDCSSFVNMLGGMLHLGLPGGFAAPSSAHGPATGDWLGFGRMAHVPSGEMRMNDLYVSPTHMGVVTGPGRGFAARSTATGTGPQPVGGGYDILRFPGGVKLPGWLQGVMGKISGLFGRLFGGGGTAGGQPVPAGVARWAGVVNQVLGMFGRLDLAPVILAQMQTESNGNQFAQNNWDSNAAIGQNSRGLMQVIPATFNAFAGPFRSRGIFDPLANVYAAVAYALSRYNGRIAQVLGHGHGYAKGGVIGEPVMGFGLHSGDPYSFGEAGPELVSPLTGAGASIGGRGGGITVNVYPQRGQSEVEIAAAVSRSLAWASAGGAA